MSKKIISGTREWAVADANFCDGCEHDCVYCYARYNACNKFHRFPAADWQRQIVRPHYVCKNWKKYDGTVMLPTTHDIVPSVLDDAITVIGSLLRSGNNLLIVSKPHLECIERICRVFYDARNRIMFRFTIGSDNSTVLKLWEPGAPSYEERRSCLILAKAYDFRTSVSCEPLLQPWLADALYEELVPFITDSIWFGKLNHPDRRIKATTPELREALAQIMEWQKDERVKYVYNLLKDRPKVRWKESYKRVVGLPLAEEAGLDV